MLVKPLIQLCALSLGLVLCWGFPINLIQPAIVAEKQTIVTKKDILAQLAQADVVYLGENHDSVAEHQAQLEIITALYQKNSQIALALEMFQRSFQPVLDRYLAGEISETQLREQTEYDQRWGFDWEYYAPILRFAKAHNLPIIALNTPTEITRKVASEGLESLSGEDFRYIPPVAEIDLNNQAYRQMLQNTYSNHAHNGHGNSDGFDNFFAAQVLWDETMADAIARFYQANPDYQIIVLAGQGHIINGYGIPDRVKRRIKDQSFLQRSQLLEEVVNNTLP
jgi:uncharacterized iron-regulated protein